MEPTTDAKGTWEECMKSTGRVNNLSYKTWFEPVVPVVIDKTSLILKVPSQFFHDWIEEHYATVVTESVGAIIGETATVEYTISDDDAGDAELCHCTWLRVRIAIYIFHIFHNLQVNVQ